MGSRNEITSPWHEIMDSRYEYYPLPRARPQSAPHLLALGAVVPGVCSRGEVDREVGGARVPEHVPPGFPSAGGGELGGETESLSTVTMLTRYALCIHVHVVTYDIVLHECSTFNRV